MRHDRKPCPRCGWTRTTNTRTPDLCTSCRGINERTDVGDDRIEWRTDGLIQRGTVLPPTPKEGDR